MTYKSPLDVFSFDKITKTTTEVKASAAVSWKKLYTLPFGTISWTLRNTGAYPIVYALENSTVKRPTFFETLDPDVTVVQDTIPRFIYIANVETTLGNDTDLYFEVTRPETEEERKAKERKLLMEQIRDGIGVFRRLLPRLFGVR